MSEGSGSSSDEAGSSSSYSESGSGDDHEGFGEVNLCYERVVSLQCKTVKKASTYAKTGGSAKRVRRVLNNPIYLGCQPPKFRMEGPKTHGQS